MKVKEERKSLEKMIETSPDSISKNVATPTDIPEIQSDPRIKEDLTELTAKCETEARIMITNAIAFMIPIDMVENNDYLKNKLEVDIMSLSGMIYQLRINQIVQKTLTEEISTGVTQARMFEVFAGMSKTIGELNKQLIQTVEAIKETYRAFREDVKEKRTETLGPSNQINGMLTAHDGSVVTRGTKELINNVKRIKQQSGNDAYFDDAQLVPDINIQ